MRTSQVAFRTLPSSPFALRAVTVLFAVITSAQAVTPRSGEFSLCRRWVEATLNAERFTNWPALKLLHEDTPDAVTRVRSWRGTPFQIAEKTYQHGLAFNSTKHFLVRLGQPADRFTAEVGLENNDDTRRGAAIGNGSVTFHVRVGDREVATTPVMRLQDPPRALDVDLGGASEFEIRVKDGGDGRGWDQALWADAVVKLRSGETVRLQDLPWSDHTNANPHLVSFVFDGQPSSRLLEQWKRRIQTGWSGAGRVLRLVTFTDPNSGLEVSVELEAFDDFPAVEWVARFANTGETNTPILANLRALDTALTLPTAGSARLHWAKGAVASFDDFAPQERLLKPGATFHLQPGGGRSSSQVLPFFNLEGAGSGVIMAIGWSGEWAADFAFEPQGAVRLQAGQARTYLVLHPGEQIRTPRMLLLFYQGDRWRGQNLLRQFLLTHHRPKRGSEPLVAPITCGNWGGTRAEVHLDNIRQIVQQKLPVEYYWIDAEWFGQSGAGGGWPVNVGRWTIKKDLYPEGFKPISDALRAAGRELLLWFEPERVFKGTPWHREHREWLFDQGGDSSLWNLGDPAARRFLTGFISACIGEFGLGCYRQDFNIDPLPFWQRADAPDRQGLSEIRHIEGLYAFWDELLKRHPNLILDNCASGGRRIDLETVGRATPFWRTDGPRDAIAHQCHSYGLMAWVPLSATSQDRAGDDYEFRSSMSSGLCLNWWVSGDVAAERIPANFPFAWARRTLEQYLKLRPYFYGDYYPLTPYSQVHDVWMAYQLNRPEQRDGLVVALRRPGSPYESARFSLHDLDPTARYQITHLDSGEQQSADGKQLLEAGLRVSITAKPGSALLVYRRE